MTTTFSVIGEEFEGELNTIESLIAMSSDLRTTPPRVRIACANSSILLLAANFEEFIREMIREYARFVVASSLSYDRLPDKLATAVWKRAMNSLGRINLNPRVDSFSREGIFSDALTRFTKAYEFCKGDLKQDIYADLAHNSSNLTVSEVNGLFKLCGLENVCAKISHRRALLVYYDDDAPPKVHALLTDQLNKFMAGRNLVAHEVGSVRSSGSVNIAREIGFFAAFSFALVEELEELTRIPEASTL